MISFRKTLLLSFFWIGAIAPPTFAEDARAGSRFDGVYEISVKRIWRDEFWHDKDNPYYEPGKIELIHTAKVEVENDQVIFLGLTKTVPTAGPAFDDFNGRVSESGVLSFSTGVNILRGTGKVAPYALMASVNLKPPSKFDQMVSTKPKGFNEAWAAYVTVKILATENSDAERLAAVLSDKPWLKSVSSKQAPAEVN
jgi:hypothetical protein